MRPQSYAPGHGTSELPFDDDLAQRFQRDNCAVAPDALPAALVRRWRTRALTLVSQFAVKIERRSQEHTLSYRVVAGNIIRDHWPGLYAFYRAESTREWVRKLTQAERVLTSANIRSAVNINVLDSPGNAYRWHLDAVPYTLILFLTDSQAEDGGVLEIAPGAAPGQEVEEFLAHAPKLRVLPRAGTAVLMDGTRCYHRVTPILRRCMRVSVPMVYPVADDGRPAGLDDYLYGQT